MAGNEGAPTPEAVAAAAAGQGGVEDRSTAPWPEIWAALGLSLAGTALFGGAAFLLRQSVWWLALAGVLALFGAACYLGWRQPHAAALSGALLSILYFGIAVAILFGGALADALPEPLPGLDIGDSTFFFVWPLLQLAAGVSGCLAGGRIGRRSPSAEGRRVRGPTRSSTGSEWRAGGDG